jgi:hypothetical protein
MVVVKKVCTATKPQRPTLPIRAKAYDQPGTGGNFFKGKQQGAGGVMKKSRGDQVNFLCMAWQKLAARFFLSISCASNNARKSRCFHRPSSCFSIESPN